MSKRIDWLHILLLIIIGVVLHGYILARVGWAECVAGHEVNHIYIYEWEYEDMVRRVGDNFLESSIGE